MLLNVYYHLTSCHVSFIALEWCTTVSTESMQIEVQVHISAHLNKPDLIVGADLAIC